MSLPNVGQPLPTVGGSNATWGTILNTFLTAVDTLFGAAGHTHAGTAGNGPRLLPTALNDVAGDGIVAADLDGTFHARTLTGGNGVGVTNGTGAAGNPTLAIDVAGMTALTAGADDDLVPVGDTSDTNAPRKMTRANFLTRAKVAAPTSAVDVKGAVSGTITCDTSLYSYFAATINGNATFAFSNAPTAGLGCGFVLEVTNGGSFTVNWPASVDWPAGVAPTLSAAGVDVIVFLTRDAGATWRGVLTMNDSR